MATARDDHHPALLHRPHQQLTISQRDRLIVFAPNSEYRNRDPRQPILVGLDADGRYRNETGDPVRMLRNQWKRKATAHGRGQQHRALDLELIEKPGQPTFRQLLARR